MTMTLIPFRDDSPRLRRRSSRAGTGQVYYGAQLRRVLEPAPPSIVDRAWCWYLARPWAGYVLLVLAAAFIGGTIVVGTWMVRS